MTSLIAWKSFCSPCFKDFIINFLYALLYGLVSIKRTQAPTLKLPCNVEISKQEGEAQQIRVGGQTQAVFTGMMLL